MALKIFLKNGNFDADAGSSNESLNATVAAVAADRPVHIILHLHGGLIDRAAGEAAAEVLDGHYRAAGAVPLFPIWETGWTEIIEQKLAEIGQDTVFQRLLSRTAQFVRGKMGKELGPTDSRGLDDQLELLRLDLVGRALERGKSGGAAFPDLEQHALPLDAVSAPDAAGLDPAEQQQIDREIQNDPVLQQFAQEAVVPQPTRQGFNLMDPKAASGLGLTVAPDTSRGLVSTLLLAKRVATVVARVVWRFSYQRDHGFYLTVVEEILREFYIGPVGKFLWDGMKDAVANAFTADGGGAALVAAFARMWEDGVQPKVTVVGHSAGAIWASRLLKELHAGMPADFKLNLVLIAPACTFGVFADTLKVASSRVVGMRIFGMGDPIERVDAIAGAIYPASLLYFVSGVLEPDSDTPLLGMARFYDAPYAGTDFPDIATVKSFDYLGRPHAFAWSIATGFEGGNCDMRSHGGWVNANDTRLSVLSVVQHGYGYS